MHTAGSRPAPSAAAPRGGSKKQRGKFAPGEKKRLKKEKKEAKRSARAARQGFDVAGISEELRGFVLRQGDMMAFPVAKKSQVRRRGAAGRGWALALPTNVIEVAWLIECNSLIRVYIAMLVPTFEARRARCNAALI